MRRSLITVFIFSLFWAGTLSAERIEIDIHGMTCGFCVDSLQRNLGKLPDVDSAEVSLKLKKIRIETHGEKVDIERIKQTILDTGFTPVRVTIHPDAQ
ncbi:MAG: heavy-metal-associated domain-containing protein [Gammaproteobacteria bacterium]|nr:heavy-metal-associated domain-containing protein [Gammaproteobacteria bacterium]